MSYKRSDMLYDDGNYYKWSAREDKDNPYYTKGTDHSELNRTEGYEILYFINHFGQTYWASGTSISTNTYQKIEKMIRYSVPSNIKTHKKVATWIIDNW